MSDPYKPLDAVVTGTNDPSQQTFALHPLPLLNISDYYTRAKNTGKPLAGGLLGWRSHREVVVSIAFELLLDTIPNEDGAEATTQINKKHLERKRELYLQTFPSYELVGWFHILPNRPMHPVQLSLALHEQITSVCDNPILMVMDPEQNPGTAASGGSGELPLRAYEPIYIDLKIEFVELPLRIETGEAERIAVADVVKGSGAADHELASRLNLQASALRMFHQRLATIRRYARAVRAGETPPDYDLLRRINAFTTQLSKHEPLDVNGGGDTSGGINDTSKNKNNNNNNGTTSDVFDALNVQELDAMVATLLGLVMKVERDKFELNTKWLALKNSKPHTGGGSSGSRSSHRGRSAVDSQGIFDDDSVILGAGRRSRGLQHALARNPGKGKQKQLHI